jgi:hypothetical protein
MRPDLIEPARTPDEPQRGPLNSSHLKETGMTKTTPEQNKAIVLEAFETLFNKRDYAAAERFWSDHYIQHSAHIAPGRAGLFAALTGLVTQPSLATERSTGKSG